MTISDPRLGSLNADGSVESWPQTDVVGRPYERPATTQGIGDGFFVVLPLGGAYQAAVAEVTALVTPKSGSKKAQAADDAAE